MVINNNVLLQYGTTKVFAYAVSENFLVNLPLSYTSHYVILNSLDSQGSMQGTYSATVYKYSLGSFYDIHGNTIAGNDYWFTIGV